MLEYRTASYGRSRSVPGARGLETSPYKGHGCKRLLGMFRALHFLLVLPKSHVCENSG